MTCPKCGFEQPDASAPDCAKCGILFAKWEAREQQRQEAQAQSREVVQLEPAAAPMHAAPIEATSAGAAPGLGSLFLRVGALMVVLPLISFGLNMIQLEFVLLMPLESFENPTSAKLWTMGGGFVLAVLGGALGGELPSD